MPERGLGGPGILVRSTLTAHTHVEVGSHVGRYRILASAGRGGMGNVLAAHDPVLNRTVAIKLLRVAGETARAWLMREAQAMARIRHPNVVTVYDFGEFRDNVFLTMEFVEGGTLRRWMRTPRALADVLTLFVGAGRGLAAAHKVGLVHLDFKPENVLIDGVTAEPRVTDFGIADTTLETSGDALAGTDAQAPESEGPVSQDLLRTPLSTSGTRMGTPRYMAPEQHAGEKVDERADQFSFCVALFEAVTGARPFSGSQSEELLLSIQAGPSDADALRRVPAWLLPILTRGLRRSPGERFASMDALLAELAKDPAPRRRRILGAVGALALVAVGAFGYVERDRARVRACVAESEAAAGAWSAKTAQTARTAFEKSGAAGWERLFGGARAAVDAYAQKWSEAAFAACSAATVEHTQSADIYRRRRACLRNRLSELRELGRLLGEADVKLVQRAQDTAAALSPIETCADVDALLAPGNTADDPAVEHRVAELRSTLAEAKTLREAERQEAALERVTPVLDEARQIGFVPLIADALVIEARSNSQIAETREHLIEAYRLAIGSRRFITAATAAQWLTDVEGHTLSHHKEGHFWARLTESALGGAASLEADDIRIPTLANETYIYNEESAADRAIAAAQTALEITGKRHAGDERAFERPHIALGVARLTAGDTDGARREFELVVGIAERVYGPDHPRLADRLSDLATIEIADGRYDVAERELDRALAVNLRARGPDHLNQAIYLLNRSEARLGRGAYEPALEDIAESRRIYAARLGPDTSDIGILETRAAMAERALGRTAEAMASIQRAERIAAISSDTPPNEIAAMRFTYAELLMDAKGDRAHAVDLARQARTYYTTEKAEQKTRTDRESLAKIEQWLAVNAPSRR
jgi:tetratricopeptide (TPR) repeat protein